MGGVRFGSETDDSERKLREMEVWMLRLERDKLMEKLSEKDRAIQELTEERDLVLRRTDIVNKVLDILQRELENKQRMLDVANRTRDLEEKNGTLHAQVHYYRNVVDEVIIEKDNMRKGFEEEKHKVENLEMQVAGMKEKVEQAEAKLRKMRNEKECFSDDSSDESIEYPHTEFNDFGKDIAEDCFAVNQFWATYDDADDLPRDYGLVRKVYYSASHFKLKITWLEPDTDDQGEIDWDDADPTVCGKFKLGASEIVTDLRIFSHQIQCMKTRGEGSYLVYPKKGETWAIYSNWNIKWSSDPENHLTDEFQYVEILSGFDENVGIEVAYLAKVKGFVSLFENTKKNGVNISCVLQSNELYKFSHQIPSYKMTGNERKGVPTGCFELDTAALPWNW